MCKYQPEQCKHESMVPRTLLNSYWSRIVGLLKTNKIRQCSALSQTIMQIISYRCLIKLKSDKEDGIPAEVRCVHRGEFSLNQQWNQGNCSSAPMQYVVHASNWRQAEGTTLLMTVEVITIPTSPCPCLLTMCLYTGLYCRVMPQNGCGLYISIVCSTYVSMTVSWSLWCKHPQPNPNPKVHGGQNYLGSSKVSGFTRFEQSKKEDHQLSRLIGLAGCKLQAFWALDPWVSAWCQYHTGLAWSWSQPWPSSAPIWPYESLPQP